MYQTLAYTYKTFKLRTPIAIPYETYLNGTTVGGFSIKILYFRTTKI